MSVAGCFFFTLIIIIIIIFVVCGLLEFWFFNLTGAKKFFRKFSFWFFTLFWEMKGFWRQRRRRQKLFKFFSFFLFTTFESFFFLGNHSISCFEHAIFFVCQMMKFSVNLTNYKVVVVVVALFLFRFAFVKKQNETKTKQFNRPYKNDNFLAIRFSIWIQEPEKKNMKMKTKENG